MSDNTILKAITNGSENYTVLGVMNCENVTITGGRIVGEKDTHTGSTGEWGHGIYFKGCKNLTIDGIEIYDCWGDAIGGGYANELYITNFSIHDCRRQGISIGDDVSDFRITEGVIRDIEGTMPQSCIDLEPNYANRKVTNGKIDSLIIDNRNQGIIYSNSNNITFSNIQMLGGCSIQAVHSCEKIILSNIQSKYGFIILSGTPVYKIGSFNVTKTDNLVTISGIDYEFPLGIEPNNRLVIRYNEKKLTATVLEVKDDSTITVQDNNSILENGTLELDIEFISLETSEVVCNNCTVAKVLIVDAVHDCIFNSVDCIQSGADSRLVEVTRNLQSGPARLYGSENISFYSCNFISNGQYYNTNVVPLYFYIGGESFRFQNCVFKGFNGKYSYAILRANGNDRKYIEFDSCIFNDIHVLVDGSILDFQDSDINATVTNCFFNNCTATRIIYLAKIIEGVEDGWNIIENNVFGNDISPTTVAVYRSIGTLTTSVQLSSIQSNKCYYRDNPYNFNGKKILRNNIDLSTVSD